MEQAAGAEVSDATGEALAFFAWRMEKTVAAQTSNIARMKRANAVDNSKCTKPPFNAILMVE